MTFEDDGKLFDHIIGELIEHFHGNAQDVVDAATTVLVSVLMTALGGNQEDVVTELEHRTRFVVAHLDAGHFRVEACH